MGLGRPGRVRALTREPGQGIIMRQRPGAAAATVRVGGAALRLAAAAEPNSEHGSGTGGLAESRRVDLSPFA